MSTRLDTLDDCFDNAICVAIAASRPSTSYFWRRRRGCPRQPRAWRQSGRKIAI